MSEKNNDYSQILARDVLTIQLLETALALINQIRNYAIQNRIILKENPSLDLLLAKAQNLIYEMDMTTNGIKSADEKKQHFRTDDKETEPPRRFCKVFVGFVPL